jgi:hypothetical protein
MNNVDVSRPIITPEVEFVEQSFDDPGVYPSNAGSGPMRSSSYCTVEGGFKIQYNDSQMSTIAVDIELVADFIPMTADEVFALSVADAGSEAAALAKWTEFIYEEVSGADLGDSRMTITTINVTKYLGFGLFVVDIVDALID